MVHVLLSEYLVVETSHAIRDPPWLTAILGGPRHLQTTREAPSSLWEAGSRRGKGARTNPGPVVAHSHVKLKQPDVAYTVYASLQSMFPLHRK